MLLCCERMLPNFERFSDEARFGDAAILRAGLDAVWQWLRDDEIPPNLDDLREAADAQAPIAEDFRSIYTSAALDAANVTAITLEAMRDSEVAKAVEVASLARDTVDIYVQEAWQLDPGDPDFERVILADPLMQAELRRQDEDIETLTLAGKYRAFATAGLRKRARLFPTGSLSW